MDTLEKEVIEEGLWECATCAFLNESSIDSCEICHEPRPQKMETIDDVNDNCAQKENVDKELRGNQEHDINDQREMKGLLCWTEEEEMMGEDHSGNDLDPLRVEEVLDHIFSFLSFEELLPSASLVSRKWRRLSLSHIRPLPQWKKTSSSQKVEKMLQILNTFGRTSTIKSLDFSECQGLTDNEVGLLPQGLEELDISRCPWVLSATLNHLPTSLTSLNISACPSLHYDLALCFIAARLPRLERLYMTHLEYTLSMSCITELNKKNFPHLKHLHLDWTHLTFEMISSVLNSLNGLETLHLSNATPIDKPWNDSLPSLFARHQDTLRYLSLWSYITPQLMQAMPLNLRYLRLVIPMPREIDPELFRSLPATLEHLSISVVKGNPLPHQLFEILGHFPALEVLELETNAIDDQCMEAMQGISSLRVLRMIGHDGHTLSPLLERGLAFTDKGLQHLPRYLQVLEIRHASNVKNPIVPYWLPGTLKVLKIDARLQPIPPPSSSGL